MWKALNKRGRKENLEKKERKRRRAMAEQGGEPAGDGQPHTDAALLDFLSSLLDYTPTVMFS